VIYFPNAKINLGLEVLGRREDGYHELRSLFLPVGWSDVLEVHVIEKGTAGKLDFSSEGLDIKGGTSNNLIVIAHELLSADFKLPEIKARLLKVIPTEAGLGGGSSDGAYMIRAINELCCLGLTDGGLKTYAAKLGSDCPFFIDNEPTLIEGRGEILSTPEFELGLEDVDVFIVYPGVGVKTSDAFTLLGRSADYPVHSEKGNYSKLASTALDKLSEIIANDFETPVSAHYQGVKKTIEFVRSLGADYTQMTGSGSAVFGLFEKGLHNGHELKRRAETLGYTAYFGALL
jgi:4-diphosphocytidyl-2-C-methyl-D-erythritol kinase